MRFVAISVVIIFEHTLDSLFFFQLGVALGFVVPATVVSNQAEESDFHLIGEDLFRMFLGVAIFTTVLLVAIVLGELVGGMLNP